jgi:hypothetical protein
VAAGGLAILGLAVWGIVAGVQRWSRAGGPAQESASQETAEASARRIMVTVFYGADDGLSLAGLEREVLFEPNASEQAHRILEAQLEPPPQGHLPVVPPGTRVRAVFVTERNEAFVDLSREITAAHPGGSLAELCTVYSIVNAVTVNLPAITAVQILVEGQEVDTLAGHVDLRQPLQRSARWSDSPIAPSTGQQ